MYNIFMILSNAQCLLFLKIKISLINPTYWSMMLSDELADVTDCLGTSSGQDLYPVLCDQDVVLNPDGQPPPVPVHIPLVVGDVEPLYYYSAYSYSIIRPDMVLPARR